MEVNHEEIRFKTTNELVKGQKDMSSIMSKILFIIKQNVDVHGGATISQVMNAYVGIDESLFEGSMGMVNDMFDVQ